MVVLVIVTETLVVAESSASYLLAVYLMFQIFGVAVAWTTHGYRPPMVIKISISIQY